MIKTTSNKKKKYNLLFITHDDNYFVDESPSFNRMYSNLIFFHNHKDFDVIVFQNDRLRFKEESSLKSGIKCYYYKEIRIFKNSFVHFLDFNPFFISKVRKIIKKHLIDLIHVDFCYGINILRIITKIPICYNAHNVESLYWKSFGKKYYKIPIFLRSIYAKYIYYIEKNAVKKVNSVNALTYEDMKKFIEIYKLPKDKITLNQMGYKRDIFNNPINKELAREKLNIPKNKFIVIFHGNYYTNVPNRNAIKIIKDLISPQINDDDILFVIAGKMPSFKDKKNLKFIGFVKDIRYFLYAADVAIIPIFQGSGVRLKIIDYLSAKIPIITTKQAIKGLKFTKNVHGFIVNNTNPIEDMIKKILELYHDQQNFRELKSNINNLLEQNYNWEKILEKLEIRYRNIIEQKI